MILNHKTFVFTFVLKLYTFLYPNTYIHNVAYFEKKETHKRGSLMRFNDQFEQFEQFDQFTSSKFHEPLFLSKSDPFLKRKIKINIFYRPKYLEFIADTF